MDSPFGTQLRDWRRRRRWTQVELATVTGFSQRHLSFLESGRSRPSRFAVLTLADALQVPLEARNTLLGSAGFAPLYTAEPLGSAYLQPVLEALERVARSHRPFPALILDRCWNILGGNDNAFGLVGRFCARALSRGDGPPDNALRLCLEPDGLRASIVDWTVFAEQVVRRLRGEVAMLADDALQDLLRGFETDSEFATRRVADPCAAAPPVATLQLASGDVAVSLFTLHSSLPAAHDATLAGLRLETFLPADTASRRVLQQLDDELTGGPA